MLPFPGRSSGSTSYLASCFFLPFPGVTSPLEDLDITCFTLDGESLFILVPYLVFGDEQIDAPTFFLVSIFPLLSLFCVVTIFFSR